MPRFFFNVYDWHEFLPCDGIELANASEARREAIRTAGQIIADAQFKPGEMWAMSVMDEDGETVCDLSFSARCNR